MKNNASKQSLIDIWENICKTISAICLAVCVCSSILQVFCRTVLGNPLNWTEEVARYTGFWMVMFAIGPVFRERGHIGIDFLYNRFPNTAKHIVDIINDIITLAVMALFTYFAIVLMQNGSKTASPSLRIPMSLVYAGIVIGGLSSVVFVIEAMIRSLKEKQKKEAN